MFHNTKCRDGEIGRRSGLKIRRAQKACGGSIPPPGTTSTVVFRLQAARLFSSRRE